MNHAAEQLIEIEDGNIKVLVPASAVARGLFKHIARPSVGLATSNRSLPRIGEVWDDQGGIFTGICRGRDGGQDYFLISAQRHFNPDDWEKQKAHAMELEADEHRDFTLPYRAEQSLQIANIGHLFQKEWYWSCEQHAAGSGCAWVQNFGNGTQYDNHKSDHYRACAVRRVPFSNLTT